MDYNKRNSKDSLLKIWRKSYINFRHCGPRCLKLSIFRSKFNDILVLFNVLIYFILDFSLNTFWLEKTIWVHYFILGTILGLLEQLHIFTLLEQVLKRGPRKLQNFKSKSNFKDWNQILGQFLVIACLFWAISLTQT